MSVGALRGADRAAPPRGAAALVYDGRASKGGCALARVRRLGGRGGCADRWSRAAGGRASCHVLFLKYAVRYTATVYYIFYFIFSVT